MSGTGVTAQARLFEQPGVFWELYGSAEEGEGATTGNVVLALDVLGSFDFYSIPADGSARGVGGVGVSGAVRRPRNLGEEKGVVAPAPLDMYIPNTPLFVFILHVRCLHAR